MRSVSYIFCVLIWNVYGFIAYAGKWTLSKHSIDTWIIYWCVSTLHSTSSSAPPSKPTSIISSLFYFYWHEIYVLYLYYVFSMIAFCLNCVCHMEINYGDQSMTFQPGGETGFGMRLEEIRNNLKFIVVFDPHPLTVICFRMCIVHCASVYLIFLIM